MACARVHPLRRAP
jgi:hypothetical protein